MDFSYTEEERMMLQMTRDFAEKTVKPLAEETDRHHRYPRETVEKMAELGLIAYSGEIGYAFQSKPAGDSGGKRPLIPVKSATLSERSDARVFTFTFFPLIVSRN